MSKKTDPITALSAEAHTVYGRLKREWRIMDGAGLLTLLTACQALDRLRQAQAIIEREGIIKVDRFGQAKPHPATQVEKESRAALLQSLKALNLDLESLDVEGE